MVSSPLTGVRGNPRLDKEKPGARVVYPHWRRVWFIPADRCARLIPAWSIKNKTRVALPTGSAQMVDEDRCNSTSWKSRYVDAEGVRSRSALGRYGRLRMTLGQPSYL